MSDETLAAIDAILVAGGDADDVLRRIVAELAAPGRCRFAGILFVEGGELVLGPESGTPDVTSRTQTAITYKGERVAELVVDGCDDPELLERVAERVSAYCLVGWDTGGEPWDPSA